MIQIEITLPFFTNCSSLYIIHSHDSESNNATEQKTKENLEVSVA